MTKIKDWMIKFEAKGHFKDSCDKEGWNPNYEILMINNPDPDVRDCDRAKFEDINDWEEAKKMG